MVLTCSYTKRARSELRIQSDNSVDEGKLLKRKQQTSSLTVAQVVGMPTGPGPGILAAAPGGVV